MICSLGAWCAARSLLIELFQVIAFICNEMVDVYFSNVWNRIIASLRKALSMSACWPLMAGVSFRRMSEALVESFWLVIYMLNRRALKSPSRSAGNLCPLKKTLLIKRPILRHHRGLCADAVKSWNYTNQVITMIHSESSSPFDLDLIRLNYVNRVSRVNHVFLVPHNFLFNTSNALAKKDSRQAYPIQDENFRALKSCPWKSGLYDSDSSSRRFQSHRRDAFKK